MSDRRRPPVHQGELYDLLCLLTIASCLWALGETSGFFEVVGRFTDRNGLSDVLVLGFCMSFALLAATSRNARKYRKATKARDHARSEAKSNARHDALTGLANRRYFQDIVRARLATRKGAPIAVLTIDLDRFKPVNDIYGHAAGDAVLCVVAERLKALLPSDAVAARFGGDEFAAVLGLDDAEGLARLGTEIVADLARPIPWQQGELSIGATIGIATGAGKAAGAGALGVETLLHAADVAMYEGKKEGRNTVRFFRDEMDESLKARAQLEAELRRGIEAGEIEPFFQPLVSLSDGTLIGFEVLARWRHPTRGLLNPDRFIAVAEETGMIADLCWALLRRACLDARCWPGHLQLAVNISPQQLQDPRLPECILAILDETGFAPNRLEVEITETALIADIDAARAALTALREFGIRIALDDFGTGYSSLYHLRELRFDKLKIDRSYVSSLSEGGERAKLVDAIIALGRSLGMVTTAEGIETDNNRAWLADQGCTYGQGYFFGKPMTKEAVDLWVVDATPRTAMSTPVAA